MSSLFGSGADKPPSSGLFANAFPSSTATPQPATTSAGGGSLFDRITPATSASQTQSTGKGGLFDQVTPAGPSQPPATTASGSGLFGGANPATTASSQPTSSLFSTSQPEAKKNPLGSSFDTAKFAQPASSAGTSSLFAPTASQPQQGNSLFGSVNQTSSSQPAAPPLFSNQPQPPSQQQANGQGGAQAGQPAAFASLLEKGRKRNRDGEQPNGFQELPSLQLGLGDISKRVRQLGNAAKQGTGREQDSRAHYLLAASGVNPGSTRQDLDSLAAQKPLASRIGQSQDWDPDNEKYMRQLDQRLTTRMMQEASKRSEEKFNAFLEEHVDINWELQRKRIYEHFGLTPRDNDDDDDLGASVGKGSFGHSTRRSRANKGTASRATLNRSVFGQSGFQKSVIGTPTSGVGATSIFADVAEKPAVTGPDDRYLREKQRKYAEKVQELNQSRLRRARLGAGRRREEPPFPLVEALLAVENEAGGDSPQQITDAYKALREIAKESESQERQYADEYLDESPNSQRCIKIRKQIIDGARQSLEKDFFAQVESLVAKNPREANLGGIPTALSKVRAYIRIRATRKDLVPDGLELAMLGEDHCWGLIFYLLRSGLVQEAADYVVKNASHFKTIDRNIITFLTTYANSPDRRLSGRIQRDCNNVFSAMTKTAPGDSVDPYRIASYKIIGRCDLGKRTLEHINQGVEDWIWLQFNLAREVSRAEENAADVFGLEELRETIAEIGQRHFQRGNEGLGGFGTYFYLQVLGGMFEQAVAYLYSFSYTAAIHFAIALDYYGLLRVADFTISEGDLLTYNTKQLPQISFGKMIGYYTRDFRAGYVEAAVDYLALLCLNADLPGQLGRSQAELCHEALRELVLESREFARLLGDIRSDGSRLKGVIEDRLEILALKDQEDFIKTVTTQAASVADDNGRVADAVLLYHLAEDFDHVIEILNRALSESQAVDLSGEPVRLQPLKPRATEAEQQQQKDPAGSLSLTIVDDPYVLAMNMKELYSKYTLTYGQINPNIRQVFEVLLQFGEVRTLLLSGRYLEAYECLVRTGALPLTANGDIAFIRNSAVSFNELYQAVSRNIGPILLWAITCISKLREQFALRQYEGGAAAENDKRLALAARDLMVFAGLVKYRLSERVWEAVCTVARDAAGV